MMKGLLNPGYGEKDILLLISHNSTFLHGHGQFLKVIGCPIKGVFHA